MAKVDIDEFLDKLKEFDDQRSILYDKSELPAPVKIADKKKPAMKKKNNRKKSAKKNAEEDIKDAPFAFLTYLTRVTWKCTL